MKKDLRFEIVYPHPPDRVWHALTNPAALADWLMPNDFQPILGHRFRFRTDPAPGFDGIIHCQVTELDPPRRLSFTWKTTALDTLVILTLEPAPDGTRLTLEHKGFRGLKARLIGSILGRGWKGRLLGVKLPAFLGQQKVEAAHASAH